MVVARKGPGSRVSAGGRIVERDLGHKEIVRRLGEIKGMTVKVGILESAGIHPGPEGLSNAEIGTVHEYGDPSRNIPQRSFIGSAMDEQRDALVKFAAASVRSAIDGKRNVREAGSLLGEKAKAAIQSKIVTGPFVPNAPRTIALKGSSKPLIDTGHLRQSVSYEVIVDGETIATGAPEGGGE